MRPRLLVGLLLAGLATGPVMAEAPRVVTDTPAVHSMVAQVMGEVGVPVLLLDRGADPHNFQLRPTQSRALAEAELLFWVGPELTPWLARALAGVGFRGSEVTLLEVDGVRLREFTDERHDHGHRHNHAHDHGHHHTHEGLDPHAWLDPGNARVWLQTIAGALADVDPAHASIYVANATAAGAELERLERELETRLRPLAGVPLMVFHDAYGYFAERFGVSIVGTITLGDAAAPGAARLRRLRDQLREGGVICVFPEVNHSSRYVDMLVEGSTTRVGAMLDPAGVAMQPGASLYRELMLSIADAMVDCATHS